MAQNNEGVIFGANANVVGAVGGKNATVSANIVQPPRHEIDAALVSIEACLSAIADTKEKQALLAQDMHALRSAALSASPNEADLVTASKNIHRTIVMTGGAIKGTADAATGLKTLAGLFGWALPFLL